MKEHEPHTTSSHAVVENYKEEGATTVETIDIATHTAHSHKTHAKKGFTLTTPVAVIIGSIIIAGGLMGYGVITSGSNSSTPTTAFTGRPIDSTDFLDGNEKSKIVLVEYSDPECPFCVQAHPTIKQIRTEYAKKIAFTYRHFPLTQIHPHAVDESKAIFCAGKLGGKEKYFEYIDALYSYKMENQTTQLKPTGKEDFAGKLGIDQQAFKSCVAGQEAATAVTNSMTDGVAAGVQGTPASFVLIKTRDGYQTVSMIDGARPYSYFKTVIDEALSR